VTSAGGPASDPFESLRQQWLSSSEPAPAIDPATLRRAAQRLRRRVWLRNLTEWGAALLLLPLCLQNALRSDRLLTRAGFLGIALAALYVSAVLYRRGRLGQQPRFAATAEFLRAHVDALGRQASLLESAWRWYLLPFLPGTTLIYVDVALAGLAREPALGLRLWLVLAGLALLTGLLFLGVAALNRRAARALRREMAALSEPDERAL
jgi:hypothetical protein